MHTPESLTPSVRGLAVPRQAFFHVNPPAPIRLVPSPMNTSGTRPTADPAARAARPADPVPTRRSTPPPSAPRLPGARLSTSTSPPASLAVPRVKPQIIALLRTGRRATPDFAFCPARLDEAPAIVRGPDTVKKKARRSGPFHRLLRDGIRPCACGDSRAWQRPGTRTPPRTCRAPERRREAGRRCRSP